MSVKVEIDNSLPASEDRMRGVVAGKGVSDKEWVAIQHRTFVRWVNLKLKERNMTVEDLHRDLSDGVALINLIEVLSGKAVGRYFKTPRSRIHSFNNVDAALRFLQDKQELQLVNIGAADVVDGNEHCIMGLIWQLIQKYQARLTRTELLHWVQDMVGADTPYNVSVTNFSTDWNDGKAACALVDACVPGAIDMTALPSKPQARAQLALSQGEEVGIPAVLDASDMSNPSIDELSIMTYVSGAYVKHPNGPAPPQRAGGFEQGLYVEVARGPRSDITQEEESGNGRLLRFEPRNLGFGQFEINITWKGKQVTDKPIVVKNI